MSYSMSLLRAADNGCKGSGGRLAIKFFHDGEWLTGYVLGMGSKISVQLMDTGALVEDIEAHQVSAAEIVGA